MSTIQNTLNSVERNNAYAARLYSPLRRWQCRILLLHPADDGQPLVADLHVANILQDKLLLDDEDAEEEIDYTALSYCWGEPVFDHEIMCNGERVPITTSLYHALTRIRPPSKEEGIWLWVDAVCINQLDLRERSMQVPKMFALYAMSSSVEAWIGEHSEHTAVAMSLFRGEDHTKISSTNSDEDAVRKGCMEILARSWWQRIWVQQEAFAGRSLYLRCGSDRASIDEITSGLQSVGMSPPIPRRTPEMMAQLAFGERSNIFLEQRHHETDLVNVLMRMAQKECSDLRDHVYGLLGLSRAVPSSPGQKAKETHLPVDYHKSVSVVYADAARYAMQKDGILNTLLLDARFGANAAVGDGDLDLPSWTPDWSYPFSRGLLLPYCSYLNQLDSRLTALSSMAGKTTFLQCTDPLRSTLTGQVLGKIETTTHTEPKDFIVQLRDEGAVMQSKVHRWILMKEGLSRHLNRSFDARADINVALGRLNIRDETAPGLPSKAPTVALTTGRRHWTTTVPLELLEVVPRRRVVSDMRGFRATWANLPDSAQPPKAEIEGGYFSNTRFVTASRTFLSECDESSLTVLKADATEILEGCQVNGGSEAVSAATFANLLSNSLVEVVPSIWSVPEEAQEGDLVVGVRGSMLPLVVRPVAEKSGYVYIGPACFTESIFGWDTARELENEKIRKPDGLASWLIVLATLVSGEKRGRLDSFEMV